ncbi:MAG TPA: asparaginase domain-containing protein [Candidatus Limnocylindrales bacterium]|nr:asparaginase domain-containing protein [Candidatus Limnocylindrales bacterium]
MTAAGTKRIVLLTTGGTIATTTGPDGRSAPTLDPARIAGFAADEALRIESRELSRVPSWQLPPEEMARVALAARDAARATPDGGVVVTHGTTTLEFTAFLADLVLDVDTPVVLTGAMRRADDPSPDGPANLRDAIAVAASLQARGRGALVVFAGRVVSGHRAWKARRTDADAFVDLGGDLGHVAGDDVTITNAVSRPPAFSGRLETRVRLVKAVPGDDGALVAVAIEAGARGLVVEALPGAGGVPPRMADALARAAEGIPVAVTPRAPFGRIDGAPTGGTGEPLRDLDLLAPGPLTAEQAWLLLMAALGDGTDPADARRRFQTAVAAFA